MDGSLVAIAMAIMDGSLVGIATEPLWSPSSLAGYFLLGLEPSYGCHGYDYGSNTTQCLGHGGKVPEEPLVWMGVFVSILKALGLQLPLLWVKVLVML